MRIALALMPFAAFATPALSQTVQPQGIPAGFSIAHTERTNYRYVADLHEPMREQLLPTITAENDVGTGDAGFVQFRDYTPRRRDNHAPWDGRPRRGLFSAWPCAYRSNGRSKPLSGKEQPRGSGPVPGPHVSCAARFLAAVLSLSMQLS